MKRVLLKASQLCIFIFLIPIVQAQPRIVTSGESRCAIRSWFHPSLGHHFYAPSAEADPPGWSRENVRFVTWARKTSQNHRLLYRMFRPGGGHFYTTNPDERNAVIQRGFVNEEHIGYVYSQKFDDLVPLHRWYKPGLDRHFYSTIKAEGDRAGFTYEGIIGWVKSPETAAPNELNCRAGSLEKANLPETPDWAKKTEYCFGAIGNGCGGDLERAAAAASLLLSAGYLLPRIGVKLSCYSDGLTGKNWCWVSTGSIKHDNCCLKNPDGNFCRGSEVKGAVCTAEWDEAVRATQQGRAWIAEFGMAGMAKSDLEPRLSPRNRYPPGEVAETARLCAPNGTNVDSTEEKFCCSGAATRWGFLNDTWATCSDRKIQSAGVLPSNQPQARVAMNEETLQAILKNTPMELLYLKKNAPASPSPGAGRMGGVAQSDDARRVQACVAQAKAKGSDPGVCRNLRRLP